MNGEVKKINGVYDKRSEDALRNVMEGLLGNAFSLYGYVHNNDRMTKRKRDRSCQLRVAQRRRRYASWFR